MTTTQHHAEIALHNGLVVKGYRVIASHAGNRSTQVLRWDVYTDGKRSAVLQIFRDAAGAELYLQATQSLEVQDIIDAIPSS